MKHEQEEIKTKELLRLEMFSDGVFAIAITLLILEVIQAMHNAHHVKLSELFLDNWKTMLVFLTGFLTILICWINHHQALSYAEKIDSGFFWVNGFVLLVVTFTPFPTALLAEYLESEPKLASAVFGFNYFMMSVAAYIFTIYIRNRLSSKEKNELLRYYKQLYGCSVIYTFFVFLICFISVPIAMFFYLLLFVVFAFPKEFALRLQKRKHRRKTKKVVTETTAAD